MHKIINTELGRGIPLRESARLIFADPPYNFGVKYTDDPTRDELPDDDYWDLMYRVVSEASPCLVPGGTFWWLCPSAHFEQVATALGRHSTGLIFQYMVIKEETFAQYQQRSLADDYRLLFCYTKPGGPGTFNPDAIREQSERQRMGAKRADPRGRVPGRVWKFRRLQGTSNDRVDWHPAQLPPELVRRIILGWTNPGDTVLELFAGSGVMGVEALRNGRDYIGVERSATYAKKIEERLANAQAL